MPGLNTIIQDIILKWKHFPCYWPFVWGIQRLLVNSPDKGQWRRALMFSLICAWINDWVNNREAGDLRCHCTHYDVTVMHCNVPMYEVWLSGRTCVGNWISGPMLWIIDPVSRDYPHIPEGSPTLWHCTRQYWVLTPHMRSKYHDKCLHIACVFV